MKLKISVYLLIILISFLLYNCTKNISASDSGGTHGETSQFTSYKGMIMCGYQGWFNCHGDGADLGWKHYEKGGRFKPGYCTIDYWPDVSELDNDEKYRTEFVRDNTWAYVYSSANEKSVKRHFKWMEEYGIDGVFVQRFVTTLKNEKHYKNLNNVLNNCLNGAEKYDRAISVMYDMSGCGSELVGLIKEDWKRLTDYTHITNRGKNQTYLYHNSKPLVAIWGAGFNDNRRYTLEDIEEVVTFFKEDSVYGGCSVLLGIPTYWRTLSRDCISDPAFHELIKKVDIIHTWNVGRYGDLAGVDAHRAVIEEDLKWCEENNIDYVPSVFPGFSWHNLKPESPLNAIPRLKGKFMWRQFYSAISAGCEMIYVSMFDEMDEGTAIFKCTNNPPNGESQFLDYEGLPTDFYLKLTGEATKMLRGEIALDPNVPLETD